MTRDELIGDLEATGHVVNARRLTDWVQKGFLPPPVRHGRGRGRGTWFEWSPACVEQAAIVADLFAIYCKASDVRIVLWMLGYPVSTADARRAILKRIELLSFFADLRQTIGDGAESADDWADAVSRFVAAGPARVRSGDPKLPTTDELFWQTLVNPSFHVTRDILHEVQHELHSLPQASRLRQQDLRDMVYFIQHQVRVADVYEVSAHAALMDWDHAKVTWDEVWRAGRRFAAAVGWSRPEWRVVSYRFVQVVAPWILVAILALRQRGQEAWLQQTASSIASTLESIAGDLATNPELLDPLTGMIERRLDHLAPMLARAPRPPRLHGPSTESHSTLA